MSLQDASSLSQVVAALAIIASLIFVGVQLRQGNRIARAQMTAAVSDKISSMMQAGSTDTGLARAFGAVVLLEERATDDDFPKLMFWFNGWLHIYHSAWVSLRDGLIDDRMLQMIETNVFWYMSKPPMARGWLNSKPAFPNDFVAYVDSRQAQYAGRVSRMFEAERRHRARPEEPVQGAAAS